MASKNGANIPEARAALDNMKYEIARELGLGKSTVSNFCLRNGVETGRNNLIETPFRGNVVHAGSVEKQSVPACKVTVTYAEKPNEAALADALKILMNVR